MSIKIPLFFHYQHQNVEYDLLSQIRRRRVMQICAALALGLIVSLLVAVNHTFIILALGLSCIVVALGFAFKYRVLTSAYILLIAMTIMLFALAITGAGLFDLAVLGYPALLICAAVLGGRGLFSLVIGFVILQCMTITWLTLNHIITPYIPTLSWTHLLFVMVIFVITGFSVYILVNDIKRLSISLQHENEKVQKSKLELVHLAHHDTLTKLPNRLYGEALFSQALARCHKDQHQLALFYIDLDNFKPVNDALGHAAGDSLLEQLTHNISLILPPLHHLIRFGGDEFLLLAPFESDRKSLHTLAEQVITCCASEFDILQNKVVISASIGIACAPQDGIDFKHLCRRADLAMYQAKQDGRCTFHFYDESLDTASDKKFTLLQMLRPALEERQFTLNYQPMVNFATNETNMVEALLRWPQTDGSIIAPDQFVPLAESNGLINELGAWVIQQACKCCALQRKNGAVNLRIAVNISVIQFHDGKLQSHVEEALQTANLPAEALELEITESLLLIDTDHIQRQLSALSQMGITIAIDDFGMGYSNLKYLRSFYASKIKIDRSFIATIHDSSYDESLVKAIISMADSLGLSTVAEGIEDESTLVKLNNMGCDIGQGYFWSRPLSQDRLTEFLTKS